MRQSSIIACVLLYAILGLAGGGALPAFAQTPTQAADPFDDIQRDIIALRNEFKQWAQRTEQDQETIRQHIGDKLTALVELVETGAAAYPERVAKAAELQAAVAAHEAGIAAFEGTIEDLDLTLSVQLDHIGMLLTTLKARGVPRRRGATDPGGLPVPATAELPPEGSTMQFPPGQLFRAAYGFFMEGDYDTAIAGFQKYLFDFPDTTLAGAAQYWIAEALVRLAEYDTALQEYDRLITHYPNNDKLPDGYYGKATVLLRLGYAEEARQAWQYVVDHYRGTIAARKAEDRLRELR